MTDKKAKKRMDHPPEEPFRGIPGLDELALRLQIPQAEEPYVGVIMFGVSGRAYPVVDLLSNFMQFTAQAFDYMIRMISDMEQAAERTKPQKGANKNHEPHQKHGFTETLDPPDGDPKVDKS